MRKSEWLTDGTYAPPIGLRSEQSGPPAAYLLLFLFTIDMGSWKAGSGCAQRCRLNIGLTAQEAEVRAVSDVVKPMVL